MGALVPRAARAGYLEIVPFLLEKGGQYGRT